MRSGMWQTNITVKPYEIKSCDEEERMNRMICLLLLMVTAKISLAQSFGVVGEVFPVKEKSFLELIEERLKVLAANGELEAINQRWLNQVANHTNRPAPLGLERANSSTTHNYLPEITLSQDIKDSKGRVLFSEGTKVNALKQMPSYQLCWFFLNAEDEAQLRWAEKQTCQNPKWVLTGGAINLAEKRLQAVVYFDQSGRITKKLNIQHVPAKVSRIGNYLVILEQAIKENGDVL